MWYYQIITDGGLNIETNNTIWLMSVSFEYARIIYKEKLMTKLEKMIKDKNVVIYNLTRSLSLSQSTIYDILNGDSTILRVPTKTAIKICNYLDCSLIDLVEDDDPNYADALAYCQKNG